MQTLRLHPATWWLIGGSFAVIAGSAVNHVIPLLISAVAVVAILIFRETGNWARSLKFYLVLASAVIVIRIIFRIVFSYSNPVSDIALELPRLSLNFGLGSIELLGSVSWIALSGALLDGLRLAAIILAIAMATTLANPRQLLKAAPGALFEIATSVSVAINLAPQLIESFNRVRKARELRGKSKRTSRLAGILIPVLEDTLDRSLLLAASMDTRGFGRRGELSYKELLTARSFALLGLVLNLCGVFILLSGFGSWLAFCLIVFGVLVAAISVRLTSRRKVRTTLTRIKRTWLDYTIYLALVFGLLANFTGWLR